MTQIVDLVRDNEISGDVENVANINIYKKNNSIYALRGQYDNHRLF